MAADVNPSSSPAGPHEEALARASATFAAIGAPRLHDRSRHLFGARRRWLLGRHYETLWPFAGAWSALCTFGSLPGQHRARRLLDDLPSALRFYGSEPTGSDGDTVGFESVVRPPLGSGGDRFYDDNAWLGLALAHHHELTGNPCLLPLARRLFAFVVSGWSDDQSWHLPGGVRWKEPMTNRSRNTCANGPAAELSMILYERTRDQSYLEWAGRIYGWTRHALLTPADLYADRITPEGVTTPVFWSYNQGTMIGAGVLIARSTGDVRFLDQAAATAEAYLDTCDAFTLVRQDPAFNAVFFRNLLMLDEVRPDRRYRDLMRDYADVMWRGQHLRHGLFKGPGSPLNNSASMLEVYSLLAGARPHP